MFIFTFTSYILMEMTDGDKHSAQLAVYSKWFCVNDKVVYVINRSRGFTMTLTPWLKVQQIFLSHKIVLNQKF